jgi:hypothetical protein
MDNKSAEDDEREILEVLDRLEKRERTSPMSGAIIPWDFLRSQTSFGLTAYGGPEFFSRLEILEQKGMVKLLRTQTDCGVALAPSGRDRLLRTEEAYQSRHRTTSHFTNTFNAPVGQVAQTTGPHSPIQQNQTTVDPNVLALVEQLIAEIKNHRELPPDAASEAEQLRIELKKERPMRERIVGYLETLKVLAGGVASVNGIIETIQKLITTH